jgi:hypothetical protein
MGQRLVKRALLVAVVAMVGCHSTSRLEMARKKYQVAKAATIAEKCAAEKLNPSVPNQEFVDRYVLAQQRFRAALQHVDWPSNIKADASAAIEAIDHQIAFLEQHGAAWDYTQANAAVMSTGTVLERDLRLAIPSQITLAQACQ